MKIHLDNDWNIKKDLINIEFLSIHYEPYCGGGFIFWLTILGFSLVIEK